MHINMRGIATSRGPAISEALGSHLRGNHIQLSASTFRYLCCSIDFKSLLPLMELIRFWLERKQQPLEMISQIWNSPFSFVFVLFVCCLNSSNKETYNVPYNAHVLIKHYFLIPTCRWLCVMMNTSRKSTWGGCINYRKHIFHTAWMWRLSLRRKRER